MRAHQTRGWRNRNDREADRAPRMNAIERNRYRSPTDAFPCAASESQWGRRGRLYSTAPCAPMSRWEGTMIGALEPLRRPRWRPRTASIAGPFGLGLRQLSSLGTMTSSNAYRRIGALVGTPDGAPRTHCLAGPTSPPRERRRETACPRTASRRSPPATTCPSLSAIGGHPATRYHWPGNFPSFPRARGRERWGTNGLPLPASQPSTEARTARAAVRGASRARDLRCQANRPPAAVYRGNTRLYLSQTRAQRSPRGTARQTTGVRL